MNAETSKTTTCTGIVLTGVGTGPIIRGPWHRACPTELIARAWRTMESCWSASIRSASCLDCRTHWRMRAGRCKRDSPLPRWVMGAPGASVAVQADPQLICQRCLKGFVFKVAADSEIEFASSEADAPADSPREIYLMDNGSVSLRELAEEELLLALPLVAVCSTAEICGRGAGAREEVAAIRRFAGFVEENLRLGQTTHGSSKKQKDPIQARHAPLTFRATGTCGVDRREERRDAFAPSHFPGWILSRQKGAADQGRCGSRGRIDRKFRAAIQCRSKAASNAPCLRRSILPSTP